MFVPGLRKWGDRNARLLGDAVWEAARTRVCEELDLAPKPDKILAEWTDGLDKAHREFADGLAANPAVRIEQQGSRDRTILTGLDRLDEPASLVELDNRIGAPAIPAGADPSGRGGPRLRTPNEMIFKVVGSLRD
ncbi:hypothetical protein [Streptomyces sp. MnatMP-M27]|uniref:hypothetical protein n=1 Tax=Streptomyces sp. MnatMP-M27 TaxID=1839768 RepID=UPI00210DBCC6|nr:hypothetical protein [Streptomyces sp. MnatMP-M27]